MQTLHEVLTVTLSLLSAVAFGVFILVVSDIAFKHIQNKKQKKEEEGKEE